MQNSRHGPLSTGSHFQRFKKMVLLNGPHQAGKTTLAKKIALEFQLFIFLNYDRFQG